MKIEFDAKHQMFQLTCPEMCYAFAITESGRLMNIHWGTPLDSFSDWIAIWRKDAEHLSGFAADYEYAAHRGLPTCILVPDDPAHYKKAIELGCKMFTSDDPAKAVEILKKLGVRN